VVVLEPVISLPLRTLEHLKQKLRIGGCRGDKADTSRASRNGLGGSVGRVQARPT
jgi:hypothetical protein